ncbi:MAG: hypothetical protein CFE21_01175 [Bacteroidetes bacterium B1(2017)]|nr:MAG: hypothetical protein CFE21_01175 [Bacteroidetes bacterium B1(2017)]
MNKEIQEYNTALNATSKEICDLILGEIESALPNAESKVWHGHPVWFLNENPIVGYSVLKNKGVQLLFWSGQTFEESNLLATGKFKAAEKIYASLDDVFIEDLKRWLLKAEQIQWDYKNIVKRKGVLERLK